MFHDQYFQGAYFQHQYWTLPGGIIPPPGGGKADIVYASMHGSAQANRSVITVGTI